MDKVNASKIQLALMAIAVCASTQEEIQESPVNLPETFGGNEDGGKRPMSKAELETFIDHRWRSHVERLEKEVERLKTRLNALESKGK